MLKLAGRWLGAYSSKVSRKAVAWSMPPVMM